MCVFDTAELLYRYYIIHQKCKSGLDEIIASVHIVSVKIKI